MSEDLKSCRYEPIALSNESTVVAEFLPEFLGVREAVYQSEAELEKAFIKQLQVQAYEYLPITSEAELIANLRRQLEKLNKLEFSDAEWERFFSTCIAGSNDGIIEKTARIQEDHIQVLKRDDGSIKNIYLIDKQYIHNNYLQVINQYEVEGARSNRYDVTVLVNGLPMVHVELKRRGVDIREAFNQINRYQRDSFWAGCGLFEYVQLFVISNGTLTKYYSNTVRDGHLAEQRSKRSKSKTSNSFSFTSWWADAKNQPITELAGFTKTFFAKHSLLNVLTRYCVFDVDRKLLVMRPYQIVAAERILQRIGTATNHKQLGTVAAGGYIWHTTGSGKTLTSFKAAQLARGLAEIDKVLFVVDRKDLDYQTMREYERFEKGAANSNTSTAVLQRQLEDPNSRIIITTIQKLSRFVTKNKKHPVYDQHVVVIFDECHRSQFGDMHAEITRVFKRYHLFGFTGTPIFEDNASKTQIAGDQASLRTTVDLFERELHAYTITHAIEDRNVLKFHVDYFKPEGDTAPKAGETLTKRAIVEAILAKHDIATHARRFNALFATASINDAIEYYELFKAIQAEHQAADPDFSPLKIACVFSPPAQLAQTPEERKDIAQLAEDLEQERADNENEPEQKKEALKAIIADYNARYGTNHKVAEFDLYYQDVQKRIKDQQFPNADLPHKGGEKVDIVIVVDMLLTGFDSKYLNTLYVDKNLKHHGLIQAFSRTNRVLNATKPHGQILDFRAQKDAVDAAITLFSGGKNDAKAREIWLVDPAPTVVEKLKAALGKLGDFLHSQDLPAAPDSVPKLKGDEARAAFIERFREVQRLKTQLDQYTDLTPETKAAVEQLLPRDELNAYRGVYLATAQRLKEQQGKHGDSSPSPAIEQLDFEFVLFASAVIDYDYIIHLLANFSAKAPGKQSMSREQLIGLIEADAKFIDERELITAYVRTLQAGQGLDEKAIREGYQRFKRERQSAELDAIADTHGLARDRLAAFTDSILQRLVFDGEQLTELMAPLGLGWRERRVKELALMDALVPVLKKRAAGREISGLSAYES